MPRAHRDSCTILNLFTESPMTTEDKHKEELLEKSSLSPEQMLPNHIPMAPTVARFVKNSISISVNSKHHLNTAVPVHSLLPWNPSPKNVAAREYDVQRKRT